MQTVIIKNEGRADVVIGEQLPNFSRSKIKKIIKNDLILLYDKPIKPSTILRNGDEIIIKELIKETSPTPNIFINIVFECNDFAIIEKPPYIKVHPVNSDDDDYCITTWAIDNFKTLSDINGNLRPGIVHRLDKDTSGLLMIAKNNRAHEELARIFKKKLILKKYTTLVHGKISPAEGIIKAPIARSKKKQMMKVSAEGKMAVTKYKLVKNIADMSLLDVTLITGRTHQIRVHFSKMGYPVAGDYHYSNQKMIKEDKKNGIKRLFLHCSYLEFKYGSTKHKIKSPLPDDLVKVITAF